MTPSHISKPDYLFETSWEVCNKVGGIYTVISTKAPLLVNEYGDNYILLGPEVYKELGKHPEFTEMPELFSAWRIHAHREGLTFRIGRWEIPGNPIAILVDFTPYFGKKNEIFTDLWEKYHVDSLQGQWDYIEPALFGYAAAKVIESFYDFYLLSHHKIVAHFHEWMTGTGVLYLEDKVPQVGTIFTTHATILGRTLSGNGLPLYRDLEKFESEQLARYYDIISKYSLEKIAASTADCFTCVSDITGKECEALLDKKPDIITPNGFHDTFVPKADEYNTKRSQAREVLFEVAEAMLGYKLSRKSLLAINSGRYEFRNKGVDLYIDALGNLNKEGLDQQIVAFITIPAHNNGYNKELRKIIDHQAENHLDRPLYTSHYLFNAESDPILDRIRRNKLFNRPDDKVKIIFVPAYLDGKDGIFNKSYYELLCGFDISVFPSYYEPWGYTPLESAAFSIPTITTTLAGFGRWIKDHFAVDQRGVYVIERNEDNYNDVLAAISEYIRKYLAASPEERNQLRADAYKASRIALWDNFILNYFDAFHLALGKTADREDLYFDKKQNDAYFLTDIAKEDKPVWKKVFVEPSISGKLDKLLMLSRNLWWTWNYEAQDLFQSISDEYWEEADHNPLALLDMLSFEELTRLEDDEVFLQRLNKVYSDFESYMKKADEKSEETVAYFSMEYGIHESLKIYSGGLGILAGDYLKQASDSNKNMVAVGLLYRYGYFNQSVTILGDQVASYIPQKFTYLPLQPVRSKDGDWFKVSVVLPGRDLFAKVWRVDVGRIPLYLLDTDIHENNEADRQITHQLYGGDWENRFKQELLLGVGGIRFLKNKGIRADIYHINEGHGAFAGLERLRHLVQVRGMSFQQAVEIVRNTSLFTTHTPVPAGHDAFDENMLRKYIPHYASRLNIPWETFLCLGKFNENDPAEKFSMSVLAVKLSQYVNGVSKIHGRVSREMFQGLYPGYFAEEVHIGHVTNGVHYPTWTGSNWQKLYDENFNAGFGKNHSNPEFWKKIYDVPDQKIWKLRTYYRKSLIDYLKSKLASDMTARQEKPKNIIATIEKLDDKKLTIGFARRFATYKRAWLLFSNLERLDQLVNNEKWPVQFIYAGKAHPADKAGQDLMKRIVEVSKMPQFLGKVVFVENYDMAVARKLVQGVDVWLNTPTRPLEASGTSGEKALMNGVLNFSVLDGWWAEGYRQDAGWAIREARTYNDQHLQDELDSEIIYYKLEEEVIPAFYDRENDVPHRWVGYIKNSIAQIAPHYTMRRMIDDYYANYYTQLFSRAAHIKEKNFSPVRKMVEWKNRIEREWNNIEVTRLAVPDSTLKPLKMGDNFIAEIELKLHDIAPNEVGIDIVFGKKENDEVKKIIYKQDLKMVNSNGHTATFSCKIPIDRVGVLDYAFRIFPVHPFLAHRQDFPLLKWI